MASIKTYHTFCKPVNIKCKSHLIESSTFNQSFFEKNKYEFTQQDVTRLFFDIDLNNPSLLLEKELIRKLDLQKNEMSFVYTNGSTQNKVSFHIIFYNITIQKPKFKKYMARQFLSDFFTEYEPLQNISFNELFKAVDDSVYGKKCFMRLPYAIDSGKLNQHIPNDVSNMKNFLITYTPLINEFEYEEILEVNKIKYKGPVDNGQNDPLNIKKYKKNLMVLLERINKERFQEYKYWLELMFLMKGRDLHEDDFIRFSKESEYKKFDEEDIKDKWFRCDAKPMLGMTRAIEWAIEDNIDYMSLIYTEKEIKDKKKLVEKIQEIQKKKLQEEKEDDNYNKFKNEFELTNSKISSTSNFISIIDDQIIFKSKSEMITSYQHLEYNGIEDENGEKEDKKFIGRWMNDPKIKIYKKIDSIPHTLICPNDVFNTWGGYPKYEVKEYDEKLVMPFLDHIDIICGHDKSVSDYVIHWIAHMLQKPEEKIGKMLSFSSKEGAGKGLWLETLKELIGANNVFDTTSVDPITGQFNSVLSKKLLICFNELNFRDINPHDGKLKGLITDPTIFINGKNQPTYEILSYHRFISFTNNENLPIQTSKHDRRKCLIQCADDIIGNLTYGRDYMKHLKQHISHFHHYLMSLDVADFRVMQMPVTQYQKDIQELFTDPVELWLQYLANQHSEMIEYYGSDGLQSYECFRKEYGINLELSSISLSMRLKNIKCKGVSDIIKTKQGNKRIFTRSLIRLHYKMDDNLS